jgi:hypothetical protein
MKLIGIIPHPDDEIIGLYRLINAGLVDLLVVMEPVSEIEREKRLDEMEKCAEHFRIDVEIAKSHNEMQILIEDLRYSNNGVKFMAPDPLYETHPLHKKCAAVVDATCSDEEVFYYSTQMNTPYLDEIGLSSEGLHKRATLDRFYQTQKSLWDNDYRYWLFEGYRKKILTKQDIQKIMSRTSNEVTIE